MKTSILLSFVTLLLIFSCTKKKSEYKIIDGFTQGSTFHIKYQVTADSIQHFDIYRILGEIDSTLSVYNKLSIISRINNNDSTVRTNTLFNEVYKASENIYKMTDGLFDITVGPLVRAWGFMPEGHLKLDSAKVDSLILLVGMNKISLTNNYLHKDQPEIRLDVNAIAQGFTVDKIAEFLESKKIINYIIEVGGEVRTKGTNDEGKPWSVGIDKPESNEEYRELQNIIAISDKSLATSGSYRKFFEENGIKYSHTVNPKTGYPTHHNLLSVTIVTNNCTDADAIATAVMVMGLEKGKTFIEKNKTLDAYLIYCDEKGNYLTWNTPGIEKMIQPVN